MVNKSNLKSKNTKTSKNIKSTTNPLKSRATKLKSAKNPTRAIILGIIITSAVAVFGFLAIAFFNRPEAVFEGKLDRLAKEYYEDYFYENLLKSDKFNGDAEKTLSKYKDSGIASLSLDQLLLMNEEKYAKDRAFFEKYCGDLSKITLQLYPEPPYERSSYRKVALYSCNF